jgi:hypothetical protein
MKNERQKRDVDYITVTFIYICLVMCVYRLGLGAEIQQGMFHLAAMSPSVSPYCVIFQYLLVIFKVKHLYKLSNFNAVLSRGQFESVVK